MKVKRGSALVDPARSASGSRANPSSPRLERATLQDDILSPRKPSACLRPRLRGPAWHEPDVWPAKLHGSWRLHGPRSVRAAGVSWADGDAWPTGLSWPTRHAWPARDATSRYAASIQFPHVCALLYGDRCHHPGLLTDPDDAGLQISVGFS